MMPLRMPERTSFLRMTLSAFPRKHGSLQYLCDWGSERIPFASKQRRADLYCPSFFNAYTGGQLRASPGSDRRSFEDAVLHFWKGNGFDRLTAERAKTRLKASQKVKSPTQAQRALIEREATSATRAGWLLDLDRAESPFVGVDLSYY